MREVSRWYDAILPILREEQLDAGGAVLAVQIDNELDFYPCTDPKGYLSFLKDERHKRTASPSPSSPAQARTASPKRRATSKASYPRPTSTPVTGHPASKSGLEG